jgi:VCBS repeat-containing protein
LNQDGTTALTLSAQQQADIEAAFTITNVDTNTHDGTVAWDYTITEGQLDFLGEGEVITAVFTLTVTDDEGAIDTQDVTITLTGSNDAAAIQIVDVAGIILEGTTLTDSGSVTFSDVDLTDRAVATEATATVTALNQDGTTALTLSAQQQADIEAAFTITNVDTNTHDGTVAWDYTITEGQLDFLAEGEVVTAVFTLTVTDDEGATTTQDVVITLTGSNDKIVASTDNIDALEQPFGTDFTMDISTQFSDVDLTDEMTFIISGLPKGLIYDQDSGVISGSLNDIGNFAIVISVDDGEALTTKTFELEILAPAEAVVPTIEVAVAETTEIIEQPVDLARGSSGEDLIQDASQKSAVSGSQDNAVSGLQNNVENSESFEIVTSLSNKDVISYDTDDSGADGSLRSSEVAASVDAKGEEITQEPSQKPDVNNLQGNAENSEADLSSPESVASPSNKDVISDDTDDSGSDGSVKISEVAASVDAKGEEVTQEPSQKPEVNNLQGNAENSEADLSSTESVASPSNKDVISGDTDNSVVTADVTVSVDENGQLSFDDTVEVIDFKLQNISFTSNTITVDISDEHDFKEEVFYQGSYGGGKALPSGLSINAETGQITGTIPEYMVDEEGNIQLEVSAYNETTKETRVLKIKINVNEVKNAVTPTAEVVYMPLNDQLEMQSENINNYGHELSKLFAV